MKVNVKNFSSATNMTQGRLLYDAYVNCVSNVANSHWIHWHAIGPKFDRIHNISDEYYQKFNEDLDKLAELNLQHAQDIPNPLEVKGSPLTNIDYTYELALSDLKLIISNYIKILSALSESLEGHRGDQSMVDDLIAYWDKELNYKLDRRA